MADSFNTELILREVLMVLQKHAIPVNTLALNISLLQADFEIAFPQLKDYKAGVFYRSLDLDFVPVTVHVQRRIPFDEIIQQLEAVVLPRAAIFTAQVQQRFSGIHVKTVSDRSDNDPHSIYHRQYSFTVACHVGRTPEIEGNVIQLSVIVTQFDRASYPTITASVGWLVDEESDSYGLKVISTLFPEKQQVHDGIVEMVATGLSSLYRDFETEIAEQLKK